MSWRRLNVADGNQCGHHHHRYELKVVCMGGKNLNSSLGEFGAGSENGEGVGSVS